VTAVVLLGDIVERPTQHYLVTEVLNMWEVSMGGSHRRLLKGGHSGRYLGICLNSEYCDVYWYRLALMICVLESPDLYLVRKPWRDVGGASENRPQPFLSMPFSVYY
jgi:hypothetical protein